MSLKKRFSGVFSFGKDVSLFPRRAVSLDLPDGTTTTGGGANLSKTFSLREKHSRITGETRSVSSPDLILDKVKIPDLAEKGAEERAPTHDGKGSFLNLHFSRKFSNNA